MATTSEMSEHDIDNFELAQAAYNWWSHVYLDLLYSHAHFRKRNIDLETFSIYWALRENLSILREHYYGRKV